MLTKVYRAKELGAALAQMRLELGPQAVILYQHQLERSRWWPFHRPGWEVLATDHMESADDGAQRELPTRLEADVMELKASLARLITAADLVRLPRTSQMLTEHYETLCKAGLAPELAHEVVLSARDELSTAAQRQANVVQAAVRRHLEAHMQIRVPQPVRGSGPLVIFMVGQSGVGKTTALAKLAARQLAERQSVALVNLDHLRPGAGAQLEALGRSLGVSVEPASNAAELASAIRQHGDKVVIFVDTPAVGHQDKAQLAQLTALTDTAARRQSFLVMTCSTPLDEMTGIVRAYAGVDLNGVILSKADETRSLGAAVTMACRSSVPMAYLSYGRRLYEDFAVAAPELYSGLLFGGLPQRGAERTPEPPAEPAAEPPAEPAAGQASEPAAEQAPE